MNFSENELRCRPIVTIGVVSFNSGDFILELLDTILLQDYTPIQLIISDDKSTDNTVTLVNEWVSRNKSNFFEIIFLTNQENCGISGNCNRILKESKGEWIKFIAGDDLLVFDCISSYISFYEKHPNANLIFSHIAEFKDDTASKISPITKSYAFSSFFGKKVTAKKQYKYLLNFFLLPAPSAFIKVKTLVNLGGFDTDFPFIEDAPLWINFTKNGYKIHYLSKVLVLYRIHTNSVTKRRKKSELINPKRFFELSSFIQKVKLREMSYPWKYLTVIWLYSHRMVLKSGNSPDSLFCRFVFTFMTMIDPHRIGRIYFIISEKARIAKS